MWLWRNRFSWLMLLLILKILIEGVVFCARRHLFYVGKFFAGLEMPTVSIKILFLLFLLFYNIFYLLSLFLGHIMFLKLFLIDPYYIFIFCFSVGVLLLRRFGVRCHLRWFRNGWLKWVLLFFVWCFIVLLFLKNKHSFWRRVAYD